MRIVPKDTIQGAALVTLMKQDGCTKVFVLNDKEVFGAGLAKNLVGAAKGQGLRSWAIRASTRPRPTTARSPRPRRRKGTDCMVYAGVTANNAVQIFKDFSAALPNGRLYGPDGIAESGFADPAKGGIPADVQAKIKVVIATLPADQYPPEGQKFFADYQREFGEARRTRTRSMASRR